MSKLIYLIGIPGSGKSIHAKEIAKKERAIILSTDELRGEFLFDQSRQKKTGLIFSILYKRAEMLLSEGKSVIIDATNIERARRMKALKKLNATQRECYYFSTPYEICLERNKSRKRKVQEFIMRRMQKNLDFPILKEGWDKVHIVHEENSYDITKEEFISLLSNEVSYEELFSKLKHIPVFGDMYEFNQENPYHSMTLCQHTYGVLEYVNEYYQEEDKLIMQVAALFHDTGKPDTKTFKKTKGHYSYFGHERVSAQLACHFLTELGFEEEFVTQVVNLVEMHMKITYGGDEGATEIYHLLGDEMLWKLYFFSEADRFAK